MLPQQKQVIVISQASTTNGATASGNIDRLGFDFATIDVITSTSDAVSNNPSVLKLAESDDTNATNFSDITAFVGDTAFTIPDSVTSGNWGVKFNVDCRGLKRYLKLSITPTTTQVITGIANLSRGNEAPVSTTSANVTALVEG
jgi:hypothetical protein